jgi:release factor glutamine methyltransferase
MTAGRAARAAGGGPGVTAPCLRGATRTDVRAWGATRLREAGLEVREAWVEAELLLRHAAALSREELLLRPSARVGGRAAERYASLIAARAAGRPSAYLTGQREFAGLVFSVDERVLIPRPETERLVDVVSAALGDPARRAPHPSPLIVDLGTGSGAIALALAHRLPAARVVATDISEAALAVARANAERLGLAHRVVWRLGDATDALHGVVPPAGADAICANPPYVPAAAVERLPRDVRGYEPRLALDGGPDGLRVHRRIVTGAARYLSPGGLLALETCALGGQAAAVAALIAAQGTFNAAEIVLDYAGLERVVVATRREDAALAVAPAARGEVR